MEIVAQVFVAMAGLLTCALVLALFLVQKGPRRAGLLPASAALSLAPVLCALPLASFRLINQFSEISTAPGGGTMQATIAQCDAGAWLVQLGLSATSGLLLLSIGLSFAGRSGAPGAETSPASGRRMAVLVLLAVVPMALTAGIAGAFRHSNRLAVAVVSDTAPSPAEGSAGIGSLMEITQTISGGLILGAAGSLLVLVIGAGCAVTAAILAWRVSVPGGFAALAALLLAAAAALGGGSAAFFRAAVALP